MTTTHTKQVTGTPRKVSSSGTQTELKTQPRLSLAGAIHSEWIKASSLRSIRWTAAVSIVVGIAMSVVMAFAIRDLVGQDSAAGYIDYLLTVTGFPATFLSLVFGVLGVFVFSNEYSSGMILSTSRCNGSSWEIEMLSVSEHPFAIVTVTVYNPGALNVFVSVNIEEPPLQR